MLGNRKNKAVRRGSLRNEEACFIKCSPMFYPVLCVI